MAELFSAEWMNSYKEVWNSEPELSDVLAEINFTSTIGYGFTGDADPLGILIIENGKVIDSGAYNGQPLNWDLRATRENWQKWIEKGLGMAGLGMAYVGGKLKFKTGDYKAMIKDPRMAGPFVKSFSVMGKVSV
ncbi:MAG: SCP-2 sterol transfer family protein [Thiotrichaceae bacterium]|nr:SCP-2 sterol transfer family protein [Thiotrichaceae bacterium]